MRWEEPILVDMAEMGDGWDTFNANNNNNNN